MLKEKYANAEDQTGLPSGAGEGEDTRKASEYEARNREVFEDDGQLDSAEAQSADALMEMNAILAEGNFDDLSDEDLAKIKNPALRAQLQGKALEAKQAAELKAHQEMWDAQMHQIGDMQYSGADMHKINKYLLDPQNDDVIERELMDKYGISREEAKKRRANLQDLANLLEKERDGRKLTPEELKRKQELQTGQAGQDYTVVSDKCLGVTGAKYGATASAEKTGQLNASDRMTETVAARAAMTGASQLITSEDIKRRRELKTSQSGEEYASAADSTSGNKPKLYSLSAEEDDFSKPLIKASALKPTFERAEASVVPLDSEPVVRKAPAIVIASAATAPQADGATF